MENNITISVKLTPYQWHMLLSSMERSLQTVNRPDLESLELLYEKIAHQLGEESVTFHSME